MSYISESEENEFIRSVEDFIINCSKKIMYYHTDGFKEHGFDINIWVKSFLIDIYLNENLHILPYNYTNFIKKDDLSCDDIIKSMNTEIRDNTGIVSELEQYEFKTTFFQYCHFYANSKLYETLLEMTREYIEEISSYSDEEDEDDE